jgi:hypothetical protein
MEPQNKVKITGIGLISDFHLFHYSGDLGFEVGDVVEINGKKQEFSDFSNGAQLVPHLKLRFSGKKDVDALSHFPVTPKSCMQYCLNKYVIEYSIESKDNSKAIAETKKKACQQIQDAITALRFLKAGYVESNVILLITTKGTTKQTSLRAQKIIPTVSLYEPIYLRTDEISSLSRLIEKISNLDFERRKAFRIALRRFENSYYDTEDEDKLIDYIIAFEALFTKGKKMGSKRDVISIACSMLLGKNLGEREKIRETLNDAYIIRNAIVHGADFREKLKKGQFLHDFVVEVEDILRRSIKKLI